MKKAIILNLPFKNSAYDKNEIDNFENWIYFFSTKISEVIITPPVERKAVDFSSKVTNLKNISILDVASFDTCDRWKAGFLKALNNPDISLFYLWSADFYFSELSKSSAEKLFEYEDKFDLVIGTIKSKGTKERIDIHGTFPMLKHWFNYEYNYLIKDGFKKPRSELLRISRDFLEFSLKQRWFPSEQTIYLILQCLWNKDRFTMHSLLLDEIIDFEQDRKSPNIIQQVERMELWLKYMWKERHKNWSPEEYYLMSEKSHKLFNYSYKSLLSKSQHNNYSDDANYRLIIEDAWRDIHHSRNQDWTALGVVFGAHVGIYKFLDYFKNNISHYGADIMYYLFSGLAGVILSVIGLLIAYRHRSLLKLKMEWITAAEDRLNILRTPENLEGIINPKKYKGISNGWLIIAIYFLLIFADVFVSFIFSK